MPNGLPPAGSGFRPPVPYGTSRFRPRATDAERWMQQGLGILGSLLMPLGLIVIGLGWFGASHTGYVFEQLPYLISGGLLGLGIAFIGGFLFFGSWLARIVHQQRQASELLATTVSQLVSLVDQNGQTPPPAPGRRHDDTVRI